MMRRRWIWWMSTALVLVGQVSAQAVGTSTAAATARRSVSSPVQPLRTTLKKSQAAHRVISGSANDFKIGMFDFNYDTTAGSCSVAVNSPTDSSNNNTSDLNVLTHDGFNIVMDYGSTWSSANMTNVLQLVKSNGLQIMAESKAYYLPTEVPNGTSTPPEATDHPSFGNNDYMDGANNGFCAYGARPNYRLLLNNVYPAYQSTIWGYQVAEEPDYYHCAPYTNDPSPYCCTFPPWTTNPPNQPCPIPPGPPYATAPPTDVAVSVPPTNVAEALTDFRQGIHDASGAVVQQPIAPGQKLIVMDANHTRSIQANTISGQNPGVPGNHNPEDYIDGSVRPDVFFEGSYERFPQDYWSSQNYSNIRNPGPNNDAHYLGEFKSIDYALSQVPEVHKVINISGNISNVANELHSNAAIANGNWLWFQAYTSIIHGSHGIWFWDLPSALQPGEPQPSTCHYKRTCFPEIYRDFVGPLAGEVRYLVNNNLLSSNPASVLFTKTDHPDDYGIVGNPKSYIPNTALLAGHRTDQYGIRYTIRTNGNRVVMIATNPLPVAVTPTFDVQHIANPIIANSTGVKVLFETAADTTSPPDSYKTSRGGRLSLSANTAVTRSISYAASTQQFSDAFGPLDTHVYEFTKAQGPAKHLWYHKALNWDAPAIAAGPLVVSATGNHLFFIGTDHRVYNYWIGPSGRWQLDSLGPSQIAASNLVLNATGDHAFFIGTDRRVYNYWYSATNPGNGWQLDWLGPTQIAASNLVLNATGNHLYFIDTFGRVDNYWYSATNPGNHWKLNQLGPSQIAASNLVLNATGNHLYFIDTNHRVDNYWYSPTNPGNHWKLDVLVSYAPALANHDLELDNFNNLYYVGSDGRIYSFYRSG